MSKSPIIFPIVIYTGSKKWKSVRENLKYVKIKRLGMQFSYNVIDLNQYSINELFQKESLIFILMCLKKLNKSKGKLYLKFLMSKVSDSKKVNILQKIYDYFYKINP